MNNEKNMKQRKSLGIACVRFVNHEFEILLVKKRYTYAFVEFVYSNYNLHKNIRYLANLFNNMTTSEKIDILTFNFDILWNRIFLIRNTTIFNNMYLFYQNKRIKFETIFANHDNMTTIKNLIKNSKSIDTKWEIPKGRPDENDSDLNCAIREFNEETGVEKYQYKLLSTIPLKEQFKSMNVEYTNIYYLAMATKKVNPMVQMYNIDQIGEVENVRWIKYRELPLLNINLNMILSIYKLVRSRYKPLN
jgi:8-oxo-dGTP pyrophosphatase MutT (NUDIX family)